MSLIAITCSHCGRDYAREYWADTVRGDPRVCRSCRRDTNRDAADAPRWERRAPTDDQSPSPVVGMVPARKQCRVCRAEYDGLVFGSASKGSVLPFGICPACGLADDRAYALATAPVVPYTVAARAK